MIRSVALALIYDVHGNLPALEAVLADACAAGADAHLLGGDYSSFGAWPTETLARLRELEATTWLRGNWERWTAAAGDPDDAPGEDLVRGALAAVREALLPEDVARLAELPQQLALGGLRACHGSPVSDMRSFGPHRTADDAVLLAGTPETLVVFGHTHVQFRRPSAGGARELVNPGSVGLPLDGDPRAAYALRRDDGQIELRRVAYDHQASAAELRRRFDDAPWTRSTAQTVATGQPPGR